MESDNYLTSPPESRLNKYELIIVAGKEARRLNELARQQGRDIKGRVTHVSQAKSSTSTKTSPRSPHI